MAMTDVQNVTSVAILHMLNAVQASMLDNFTDVRYFCCGEHIPKRLLAKTILSIRMISGAHEEVKDNSIS